MSSLRERIERFKNGEFVIVTDDESRENEGDLFLLASKATTEKLAFMIRHTSGVVCVAMTEARSRQLHLPLMVKHNQDTKRTAFTVTVDVKHGITTGISAEERANTIRALADNNSMAEDFIRPGHIFPLIAAEGGLRSRAGHTEAIIELCRRSDEIEVGAISELVNEDGSMMRGDSLRAFAESYAIPIITIAELQASLEKNEANKYGSGENVVWAELPRKGGKWKIATFLGSGGVDHAVLKFGDVSRAGSPLVRIHSECLTGDVLGSLRCDCGEQLASAMSAMESIGSGVIIYLRDQEGRGIGLAEKIRAYKLQDEGLDTVDANLALGHEIDERDFGDAVEILQRLGIEAVTLLTNNPLKAQALNDAAIVTKVEDLTTSPNPYNRKYLETKRERLGHGG
ncbi:MAG: 3,4-dihydroxy-2-butanone-4-phosphate synthase [Actinobacteria bacterium]|nr:3,4-dihydroxy-2-butanone-4-phosphate synthase [Actinomycetota bacterium]